MRKPFREYRDELLKQTEPYEYWLNKLNSERGESDQADCPLPCVLKKTESGVETGRIIEDNITYVIIKSPLVSLYPGKLEECGLTIEDKLNSDLIYFDHDYMDHTGRRHTPYFKPDYSPHLLTCENYFGGVLLMSESLAEDYRMLSGDGSFKDPESLSYADLQRLASKANKITHVSEIIWYRVSDAPSEELYEENQLLNRERAVEYERAFEEHVYALSIVIPSKDHFEILSNCIDSLINKTGFNFSKSEIIIVDNGSEEETRARISEMANNSSVSVHYLYEPADFNFSAMCNLGAAQARGDLLLFLNDDVEATEEGCLDLMCAYASSAEAGAVGMKLLYPDGLRIQHAGITNLACGPTHKLAGFSNEKAYYFGMGAVKNVLALTGACLMVSREKYFQVNGFHDKMEVSYNDVDLCVSLHEAGYSNIVLNHLSMLHHESLSRGNDLRSMEKLRRLAKERALFYERHPDYKGYDPFYHKNLIQDSLDFRVNVSADYEIRSRKSVAEILLYNPVRICNRIQLTLERSSFETKPENGEVDYYILEGWSLFMKHDERLYDRFLVLIDEDNKRMVKAEALPKLRKDVQQVFANKKYAMLAGFEAHIDADLLTGSHYRVGVLYEHKLIKTQKIFVGDYDYEPGRDIHAGTAVL